MFDDFARTSGLLMPCFSHLTVPVFSNEALYLKNS